jgi:3-oxoacyl-[acyl-carrier-protein] synthase II
MTSTRRAVVTGIGVVSPLGLNRTQFWDGLRRGQSGIRPVSLFDASALPTRIAGEVQGFDAKNFIDKKERKNLRMMARSIQLAVAASQLALDDSGVDKATLDPTRFGIEFGSGLIATELEELGPASQVCTNCQPGVIDLEKWGQEGIANIQPLWMLKYLPNMLACHVSILHNAQGPNNTITESDVASLLAFGEAYRILVRDQADFFLVGGGESKINPLSMARQCLFQHLSRRNDAPETACRPFDRHRDGLVLGEGAGVLVLEDLDHAQARRARIYAEVVGFGASFDRRRDGTGLARAARAALKEAGIGPSDLDHINAHGISTQPGDLWEARALVHLFDERGTTAPVVAPKSYIGNLGSAAGSTELAASILALAEGLVPSTLNYFDADPDCPILVQTGEPRPLAKPYFLKLGFTEMGQCAAVVCKRWEE